MKKNPTIQDVANLAGVSKATVSKYLNNTPYVSPATKKRIESAIKKLNYHPSSLARGLVNKSIKLIALVISDVQLLINSSLIKSVENEANQHGYDIVLVNTNDEERHEQNLNKILTERYQHVDGLILANARENGVDLSELKKIFEHIVLVHRHVPNDIVDYVVIDNYIGGRLAAEYLIRTGHRRVAAISGSQEIHPYRDRIRGFSQTLEEHGLQSHLTVIEGGQTLESGYQAAEKLMASSTPPTAIFATSDLLALGVLDASRDYRWQIPEELSVIGFDNIFFSRLARVPLTTIDGKVEDLGKRAVQLLLQRIENKELTLQQIKLHPSLVVRESCRNLHK
ncbi:LacI family DNA-binding transcriptional regulator [Peribacillus sp. NPDC058002]|uniref:LacI family DNA-binding transcriptional regulator n=1 Tax=Peribacillus sp. NPDC058002 TaxID=3346301 RepID=UPI0036D9F935